MIKAVVICEDHTLDEHILRPVVEQIFAELGRRCRVQVVSNPRIQGVAQALDPAFLARILANYPMAQAFFLIVDRDCDESRGAGKLADRVREAEAGGKTVFGCLAVEEVEVWALALHRKELATPWEAVRAECHPKEVYFEPFVEAQGWRGVGLGKGRAAAVHELRPRWDRLKASCPEVQSLVDRVAAWLNISG